MSRPVKLEIIGTRTRNQKKRGIKLMAYKRGFSNVREEVARSEKRREEAQHALWRWYMAKDTDEADIRFLTAEPIIIYEHTIKEGNRYTNVICHADEGLPCDYCGSKDSNVGKATFKGAMLAYDYTTYKDSKTKKTQVVGLRLFVRGQTDLSQLDRLNSKYGSLLKRDFTVSKTGVQNAPYRFDINDKSEIPDEIIEALTKKFEEYDGEDIYSKEGQDILEAIVRDQLKHYEPDEVDYDPSSDDEEEEDYDENVIGVDDEEPPKSMFSSRKKRKENQVKTKRRKKR